MRIFWMTALLLMTAVYVTAQPATEKRVPLSENAFALDNAGAVVLEGALKTTSLHGSVDSPVTNIRVVLRNPTTIPYAFVSGLITFYAADGVRCGEGIFKADALLPDEAFETDTPGIRIRCAPSTWRIVANNVLPRVSPAVTTPAVATRASNFIISVDGEEHPLQLERPMVVNVGNVQRTIVVREAP